MIYELLVALWWIISKTLSLMGVASGLVMLIGVVMVAYPLPHVKWDIDAIYSSLKMLSKPIVDMTLEKLPHSIPIHVSVDLTPPTV